MQLKTRQEPLPFSFVHNIFTLYQKDRERLRRNYRERRWAMAEAIRMEQPVSAEEIGICGTCERAPCTCAARNRVVWKLKGKY